MRTTARLAGTALSAALLVPALARAQTVRDIANQGRCSTANVEPLSQQLVDLQMCQMPGTFVPITPHSNITLSSTHIFPFMVATARDALWRASNSHSIQLNSAFRTLADQYVLYYSNACALAATPGDSNHETGKAIDVQNYSAALSALTNAGCAHSLPTTDPVHFDCPGSDMRAASIRAFQHLWNINNPSDVIAEDGSYGPITENRLSRSPANGFPMGGCAPEWGARFVAQSFPLASAGTLQVHAGDSVAAWLELRNIGTHAWNGSTYLATTVPRDRPSPVAGEDWVSDHRVEPVSGSVAMGETFRFNFTFHAPSAPGIYDEHFGMVQEGVTWFSAAGQGGPADDQLEVRVEVLPAVAPTDVVVADAALDADESDGGDGGRDDAGFTTLADGARVPDTMPGGCSCDVPGRAHDTNDARIAAWIAALATLAFASHARRRRVRVRS